MAGTLATIMPDIVAEGRNFDANEFRLTNAGGVNAALRQTASPQGFVNDELQDKVANAQGLTAKVSVIKNHAVTVRTTRPIVVAGTRPESAFQTITLATIAFSIHRYPTIDKNNYVSLERDLAAQYKAGSIAALNQLESMVITQLDAAKTQVIGEVTGGHSYTNDVVHEFGLANLQSSYLLHDLAPMQRSNDYEPFSSDVIGNQGLSATLNRMDGYGFQNQEDKTKMFDNKYFGFSNTITNGTGGDAATAADATGFSVPDGTLGIMSRVERASYMGLTTNDGHYWGQTQLPILPGINWGIYGYDEVVDASSLGAHMADETRTKREVLDYCADFVVMTKYNSDLTTIASPIIKFDIQTT